MANSIVVLGAYGSKSDTGGSSSFLLNAYNVIDAGNILLTMAEKSVEVEAIWLTHSHLDHIIDIAYILDNYYNLRKKTLKIYALEKTLEVLKTHFFNDMIWPDFSRIPLHTGEGMSISYHPIEAGVQYSIAPDETNEAILTHHTVPSCGYIVQKGDTNVLITADTGSLESVVKYLKKSTQTSSLVVECSFPSYMKKIALESKHLTPDLLFKELEPLDPQKYHLYINHIKPCYESEICQELEEKKGDWNITILHDGDEVRF